MSEPRFAALAAEIDTGLAELESLSPELARLRAQLDASDSLDLRSAGSILHDFYSGVERAFERLATELEGGVPSGADWHTSLLWRMSIPIDGIRPAVISADIANRLDDYLRFRHVFRNIYGRRLTWRRLQPLLDEFESVSAQVVAELRDFIGWLQNVANEA